MAETAMQVTQISESIFSQLTATPSYLFSILSEKEYHVLTVLIKAKHGLNVKQIQRALAEKQLMLRYQEWATINLTRQLSALSTRKKQTKNKKEKKKASAEFRELLDAYNALSEMYARKDSKPKELTKEQAESYLESIPIDEVLMLAQGLEYGVMGEPTINKAIESLTKQGFVGQREITEGKRPNKLYFLNPMLRGINLPIVNEKDE